MLLAQCLILTRASRSRLRPLARTLSIVRTYLYHSYLSARIAIPPRHCPLIIVTALCSAVRTVPDRIFPALDPPSVHNVRLQLVFGFSFSSRW